MYPSTRMPMIEDRMENLVLARWPTSEPTLKSEFKESELILEGGVLTLSTRCKSRELENQPCRTEIHNIEYFLSKYYHKL